jgi:hypothetical protein
LAAVGVDSSAPDVRCLFDIWVAAGLQQQSGVSEHAMRHAVLPVSLSSGNEKAGSTAQERTPMAAATEMERLETDAIPRKAVSVVAPPRSIRMGSPMPVCASPERNILDAVLSW